MLSFKEIKELIELVAERRLTGLEIERAGFRVRIEGPRPDPVPNGGPAMSYPAFAEPAVAPAREPPALSSAPEPDDQLHVITSPIVGTFYRAPSPEAPAFVSAGDKIERGKVLCIIEAMKLMNEIESDVTGEVAEVFPQNGQPVEYGERLFAIRTE
jgi:acetyl-CoA carboxylase biotin carboxyl carrier protein